MRKRAEQAWRLWFGLFGCAAAKAFAASLLEMQGPVGADGSTPASHKVEGDFHHAGLAAKSGLWVKCDRVSVAKKKVKNHLFCR